MAFAGVGNPMKELVCLSSILNLASRRAEKAAISKPQNLQYPPKPSSKLTATIAGAKPKLMTSASESSSLPRGEYTFSRRAAKPSIKSKTAETSTNIRAYE